MYCDSNRRTRGNSVTVLTPEPEQRMLLTVEEVARLLSLSRGKAYEMAAKGELPTVRMGRSVRIRRDKLAAWLDERTR
jgi:excisionase family DNA binding protein